VAGVSASIWFGMLVAVLAGWSEQPKWLADGPIMFLVYATLAYGLGVVVDGAADTLFTWMLKRGHPEPPAKPTWIARVAMLVLSPRTDKDHVNEPLSGTVFQRLREAALLRDDGLARFMEYQRSRQRIARAVTLNLLLLLPIGIWFLTATVESNIGLVAGFAIAMLIGIVVSGRAAERLREAYEGHLKRLPALGTAEPLGWIRAAAVCVRVPSTGAQLLVVRTKEPALSPERWTFPKGHIESGESLLEASMREADEEAGAKGIVHSDPLPPYLFPTGASSGPLVVIPFLMDTREHADPTEPGRTMRWSSPDEAKVLLRLNREAPFTNEHDRVIDRAIEVIRRRTRGQPTHDQPRP
jgi:8-oxo-dGTP pyrophosphatase MutT (NUDIX family)